MSCQRSSSVFIRSAVAFLLLLSEVHATTSDDQHGYNESSYSSTTAVKRRRSPAANVDRVESIEVEPTQITITTTKQGPVESLKIHIEMIDLQDNRALPPIDLFGLFLVVARGRYTVPFLKPERWYGLTFTSENQVNGQTNEHREQRLLRTASRQMEKISPEQLYKVYMHRNQDGEENVEQLYVTSMWTGPERIPHGELHVEVNVHCKTSTITEHMVLHSDEDSVTIEITMDLNYDIQHLNDSTHQIMARITPMKCSQVCWKSCVVVLPGPAEFRADTDLQCHTIEETTSITHLRHIKQYAVEKQLSGYELVVDTELHEDSEEGFVMLSALNLAKNDSKAKTKTFRVSSSNGTFHLPLSPDSVYAAGYEYTKLKPFRITTAEHFLLETAPLNSSTPANPLLEIKFHSENHTIGEHVMRTPLVTLSRGEAFHNRELRLHLGPFCGDKEGTHTLDGTQSSFTINLTQAICSGSSHRGFCDPEANYTRCSSVLCYSTTVVVAGDDYPSEVRCLNVSQHFPVVPSISSRSMATRALLIFTLLVACIYIA